MIKTLFKLFVTSFYRANASFFLFFFFIFFGTVNGGSLISYHASLLTSIVGSPEILCGVFLFWILYEVKCLFFLFHIINSSKGSFLYKLQALPATTQAGIYVAIQISVYLPVLLYSLVAISFGMAKGHLVSALSIITFQVVLMACGSFIIYRRMNNWLKLGHKFSIALALPKPFLSYLLYHFVTGRKMILAGLKIFSVLLLYIVLVWNAGKADNDSFLLFYLVILLAHFVIPFLAVEFLEEQLLFSRNLPLQKTDYALAYLLLYAVLLLPEMLYLFLYGQQMLSVPEIFAYYATGIASLFLLTAVLYSEEMDRDEYMKVGFALFFVSIFALHVKAFLVWICIQTIIGVLLFWTGFYKYERTSVNKPGN